MKYFVVDFNRVITDTVRHLTDAIPLGYEYLLPELAQVADGERILVDMPGELWAEARTTSRRDDRGCYWYGELAGPVHYYDEGGVPMHCGL